MGLNHGLVKALRVKAGLTQDQAAKKAGMKTRQQWNRIEAGGRGITLETLDSVAAALGVRAKDLLGKK